MGCDAGGEDGRPARGLRRGCHGREEAEPAPGKRPVRCAPVETADVEDTIELRGTVAPLPDRDAEVAPQVAGRIAKIPVREGDRVTAGQPVARIDDAGLVDQANEAAAAVAKAEAERRNADATRARTERVFEHGIAARQEVEDAATRADTAAASEREARAAAARIRRQVERAHRAQPAGGRRRPDLSPVGRARRRHARDAGGRDRRPEPPRAGGRSDGLRSRDAWRQARPPRSRLRRCRARAGRAPCRSYRPPSIGRRALARCASGSGSTTGRARPSESWPPRASVWGARGPSRSCPRRRCATARAQRSRSCCAARTASRTSSGRRAASRRAIGWRSAGSPPARASRWTRSGSPTAKRSRRGDDAAGSCAGGRWSGSSRLAWRSAGRWWPPGCQAASIRRSIFRASSWWPGAATRRRRSRRSRWPARWRRRWRPCWASSASARARFAGPSSCRCSSRRGLTCGARCSWSSRALATRARRCRPAPRWSSSGLTTTSFPVVTFNLTGGVDPRRLRDLGELVLRPAISRVRGVGRVEVLGGDVRELEVILDPAKTAALRLTPAKVAEKVRAATVLAGGGSLRRRARAGDRARLGRAARGRRRRRASRGGRPGRQPGPAVRDRHRRRGGGGSAACASRARAARPCSSASAGCRAPARPTSSRACAPPSPTRWPRFPAACA